MSLSGNGKIHKGYRASAIRFQLITAVYPVEGYGTICPAKLFTPIKLNFPLPSKDATPI